MNVERLTSEPGHDPSRPNRTPHLVKRLWRRWSTLSLWLELTRNLAVRDVEIRYKHSLLGLYWAIINPLVTAAIFALVFGVILGAGANGAYHMPYAVFLVSGLTFWNLFGNGVMSATSSITGSSSLLAKLYFPRVVLPTAAVLARLIDFGFSVLVLAAFAVMYRVPIHWQTVGWIIPVLFLELLFTFGVGYLVAALNVLYRDMSQLIGLVLMVWMYLSPVMYTASGHQSALEEVLLLNPIGALLQAERDVLFVGHLTAPAYLWGAVVWTIFVFYAGIAVFKRIEPLFAEVM